MSEHKCFILHFVSIFVMIVDIKNAIETLLMTQVFLRQFKQYIEMVKHLITNIWNQDRYNTFVRPTLSASANT